MTNRGFFATKTGLVVGLLGLVAVVVAGVAALTAGEAERHGWSEWPYLLMAMVLPSLMYWCIALGRARFGGIMAFVLRTRPEDLEKDPRA